MDDNSLVLYCTFSVPRNLFQLASPGVLNLTTPSTLHPRLLPLLLYIALTFLPYSSRSQHSPLSIDHLTLRSVLSLPNSDRTDHATCRRMLTPAGRISNCSFKLSRCKAKFNKQRSSRCSLGEYRAINWLPAAMLTSSSDTIILSSLANPKNERTLSLAFVSAPRLRREGDEVSTQCTPQSSESAHRIKTNDVLSHMLSNLETSSAAY